MGARCSRKSSEKGRFAGPGVPAVACGAAEGGFCAEFGAEHGKNAGASVVASTASIFGPPIGSSAATLRKSAGGAATSLPRISVLSPLTFVRIFSVRPRSTSAVVTGGRAKRAPGEGAKRPRSEPLSGDFEGQVEASEGLSRASSDTSRSDRDELDSIAQSTALGGCAAERCGLCGGAPAGSSACGGGACGAQRACGALLTEEGSGGRPLSAVR